MVFLSISERLFCTMVVPKVNSSWPPFVYNGIPYELDHLSAYSTYIQVDETRTLEVAIDFSDHCFTRDPIVDDERASVYPKSTRRPGHFDIKRYTLSLELRRCIELLVTGRAWVTTGGNYAYVCAIDYNEVLIDYIIIFSLQYSKRNKSRPPSLRMYINSAFSMDKTQYAWGSISFNSLVDCAIRQVPPKFNKPKQVPIPSVAAKKKQAPKDLFPAPPIVESAGETSSPKSS
jgi:hypothetical protein